MRAPWEREGEGWGKGRLARRRPPFSPPRRYAPTCRESARACPLPRRPRSPTRPLTHPLLLALRSGCGLAGPDRRAALPCVRGVPRTRCDPRAALVGPAPFPTERASPAASGCPATPQGVRARIGRSPAPPPPPPPPSPPSRTRTHPLRAHLQGRPPAGARARDRYSAVPDGRVPGWLAGGGACPRAGCVPGPAAVQQTEFPRRCPGGPVPRAPRRPGPDPAAKPRARRTHEWLKESRYRVPSVSTQYTVRAAALSGVRARARRTHALARAAPARARGNPVRAHTCTRFRRGAESAVPCVDGRGGPGTPLGGGWIAASWMEEVFSRRPKSDTPHILARTLARLLYTCARARMHVYVL